MKKKIIYWSPCLNPVGTIKSTINSAVSLSKYSKDYEVTIINACGEWDKFVKDLENDEGKVSGYVSTLNADGVASELANYLNRR